ncbi:hemerythrin domain-containing protein [Actinoallomurus spadix]|uniref:hemerythrin domain-containing protein n=1 Tax=Actinoallomurus spadix TaxID=79912 RepID=UPI0020931449|nr:hemerythrin domain-containing protein [Actinoallomurus spadix]MCO5990862.1 hemerythrin domain-containing protein [Actinoallomurus spadix]
MDEPEDLISVLIEEHRDLWQLGTELSCLSPSEPLAHALGELMTAELVRHIVAEESFVYPVARTHLPQGDLVVEQEIAAHAKLEQMMRELERPGLTRAEFDALHVRMPAEARRHMQTEEEWLFPLLAERLSAEELLALGRKAIEAKEKASIRQRLAEPEGSLLNRIVASGTTLVDRVRAYLQDTGYAS